MRLIHTFCQSLQLFCHAPHQRLFFLSAPALNLLFPIKCLINPGILLIIKQLHGQTPDCMSCAFTRLMLGKSPLKIFRASCVVTSICAFKDVHITVCHLYPIVCVGFDSAQPPRLRSTTPAPNNPKLPERSRRCFS